MSHVNVLEIDLDELHIGKSGRMVKLLYKKQPLQLVTGKLYTPFGVKINKNDYSEFTTCHLDCSLNQSQSETSVKYREALEKLDARIIELIRESKGSFNPRDFDTVDVEGDRFYSPMLRENKTYPKLMKISLPRDKNGNFDFVIFDEDKQKIPVNDKNIEEVLSKGKVFKGILECNKIWLYKGRIGSTWNLVQMRLTPRQDPSDPEESPRRSDDAKVYNQNLMIDDDE